MSCVDIKAYGRIGLRAMSYYLLTTVIAAFTGIALAVSIRPGKTGKTSEPSAGKAEGVQGVDALLDLIRCEYKPFPRHRTLHFKSLFSNEWYVFQKHVPIKSSGSLFQKSKISYVFAPIFIFWSPFTNICLHFFHLLFPNQYKTVLESIENPLDVMNASSNSEFFCRSLCAAVLNNSLLIRFYLLSGQERWQEPLKASTFWVCWSSPSHLASSWAVWGQKESLSGISLPVWMKPLCFWLMWLSGKKGWSVSVFLSAIVFDFCKANCALGTIKSYLI